MKRTYVIRDGELVEKLRGWERVEFPSVPVSQELADMLEFRQQLERRVWMTSSGGSSARCISHHDRPARDNLDGDDLCQECCDAWARAEGAWQRLCDKAFDI